MLDTEHLLIVASILLIVAIFLTKIFSRGGVPSVILCSLVGLFVGNGEEWDFLFDDTALLNSFGQVALGVIVFVGGVNTDLKSVKSLVFLPASLMASLGVIVSTLSFGGVFHFITGMPLAESMLLGSVISSTDAAAIFSVLESKKLKLKDSIGEALELSLVSTILWHFS